MAKLVAVFGSKKSGKTTTVECIVSGLTRKGYKVGSIKHIHHSFTIDREGTDTYRHAHAGARIVAAISDAESVLIMKDEPEHTLPSVLDFMMGRELDVIVVEGLHGSIGQRSDVLKIIVARDTEDLRERLRDTVGPILAISGAIAEEAPKSIDVDIPIVSSKSDCSKLVERVEKEILRK